VSAPLPTWWLARDGRRVLAGTIAWHTLTAPEAAARLGVDVLDGLSADAAAARLERHGPNQINLPGPRVRPWARARRRELAALTTVPARVRRDGSLDEIPGEQLVIGDVVELRAGDAVPADGRLLRATALAVDESSLTGRSAAATKGTDPVADPDADPAAQSDMVFLGTRVARGRGSFVVTAIGSATQLGRLAARRLAERR
jgi:hypothetical protein